MLLAVSKFIARIYTYIHIHKRIYTYTQTIYMTSIFHIKKKGTAVPCRQCDVAVDRSAEGADQCSRHMEGKHACASKRRWRVPTNACRLLSWAPRLHVASLAAFPSGPSNSLCGWLRFAGPTWRRRRRPMPTSRRTVGVRASPNGRSYI